ncbi:hypothetical protein [Allopontixanthobacter confluentis]|uniref:hypothetical protein n=1 Tax=Allopontixanthobacter confluentis TaxID=1849021 RepID=UPI00192895E0|nr:hypothetical protein [Allopontixanthobacter confluentis]
MNHQSFSNFSWSVADLLRGDYIRALGSIGRMAAIKGGYLAESYAGPRNSAAPSSATPQARTIASFSTTWSTSPLTLAHWLDWMRRNQIVPDGTAPRTDYQGSLFP